MATADSLENEFIRLKVDPKTGCITSLFDKRSKTEALALPVQSEGSPAASPDGLPCGNLLQAFVDKPKSGTRGTSTPTSSNSIGT